VPKVNAFPPDFNTVVQQFYGICAFGELRCLDRAA
jgi:hypothetical protein